MNGCRGIYCETDLRYMSLDFTEYKSTLVQVMACCRQASSHYLSQCWPRYRSPYGGTRPLLVKIYVHNANKNHKYKTISYCIIWLWHICGCRRMSWRTFKEILPIVINNRLTLYLWWKSFINDNNLNNDVSTISCVHNTCNYILWFCISGFLTETELAIRF